MKSFRTLDLVIEFYKLTQSIDLPKHLREQLNRSASSVSLNLAEGNAKFSCKEKSRIYQIAYGSFRESQAILKLANIQNCEIDNTSKHLGSSLYRLIEGVMNRIQIPEN